jgi:hypothetical protein
MALGHRATVYTVRVRQKREADAFLPLGNIDGNGTDLSGLLAEYLATLSRPMPRRPGVSRAAVSPATGPSSMSASCTARPGWLPTSSA